MLDIYILTPTLLCYEALDASAPMKGETLDIPFSEAFIIGQPGCPHTWTIVYPIHTLHILEGKDNFRATASILQVRSFQLKVLQS